MTYRLINYRKGVGQPVAPPQPPPADVEGDPISDRGMEAFTVLAVVVFVGPSVVWAVVRMFQ